MKRELVREIIFEKYIEPTMKKKENYIGVELEMPIVNLKKEPVDFMVVHRITRRFILTFGFEIQGTDEDGNVYAAIDNKTGDILSYDCSYNNLELSMGREKKLHQIQKRFQAYYDYLQSQFEQYSYTLTGMGVNPYYEYNHNEPIPNGRYRMLFHHLNSYEKYKNLPMYFHPYPRYGTFSSASQVQLDVEYEDLLAVIGTFSKLEPIKALLFSNSVLLGKREDLLCCRDMFWEHSTHGINSHNIGMFDCELNSIDDLRAYIESTSIYCVERGDKYINFSPQKIMDYFEQEYVEGEYYENESYHKMKVIPQYSDLQYLRTFKFEDLTFRGTIEFRSVCCQPIKDSMVVAAFHLGLKEKLYELKEILEKDTVIYHHGYTAGELRKIFNQREFPSFLNEEQVYQLVERIVDLAKEGLKIRGYEEEVFLDPLYNRIYEHTNPAKRMLSLLREPKAVMEEIIRSYA